MTTFTPAKQDSMSEVRVAHAAGKLFAKHHARELAVEIIEWQSTGFLRGGKLRELARILEPLGSHCLQVAEGFATRAALEIVAALPR